MTPHVDRAYSAEVDSDADEDELAADNSGLLASELLKREREIEWVSEVLRDGICEIVAQRKGKMSKPRELSRSSSGRHRKRIPLDEVVDVIKMPKFDSKSADANAYAVKIPSDVSRLVREYVSVVS